MVCGPARVSHAHPPRLATVAGGDPFPPPRIREDAPQRPSETRLLFGGDVMLSRYVGRIARERHDPASPLRDLAPVLRQADLAFVNLEAPFSDRGRVVESGMVFKAEPEMIEALEAAGIAIVSTANNHARDCAGYGVDFTLDWLAQPCGIASVGSAKTPEQAHQGTVLTRHGIPASGSWPIRSINRTATTTIWTFGFQ